MVIQDLYNVLQDANLVEEILQMTFPKLFDSKAAKQDEQMFNKPKNVQPRKAIPAGSSAQFWTP